MLNFRDQGDELDFGPQIDVPDVAALAAAGFRSIICNRPDEEEGAVASQRIAAAARAAGMAFAYQPVGLDTLAPADGARFAQLLDELPKPIAAYCRSGRRCAALWVMARAERLGIDAALKASRTAGCNLDGLRPMLEQARAAGAHG